jgi:hypothetical protein
MMLVLNFFIKLPMVFNKDFIKARRHLHYSLTFLIMFGLFVFAKFFMQFTNIPVIPTIVFGWLGGWMINALREGYREDKYDYPFDWLDVFAGTWGGITASIVYMIIFK